MTLVLHTTPNANLSDGDFDPANAQITNLGPLQRCVPMQAATRPPTPIETRLLGLLHLAKIKRDAYSVDELTLEFNRNRVEGMPDNLKDYIKQRKWGCTCGACAEGWMSPRMRYRIYCAADLLASIMMDSHEPEFPPTGVHPDPEYLYPDVPPELHPYVTLEFWIGYTTIVSKIAELLESDLPLTEAAVIKLAYKEPGVGFFLDRGGKVVHALEGTMDMAWEQSSRPGCDGLFEKIAAENDEYMALPTCKNDLNFELVRDRLGLRPDVIHGCNDSEDNFPGTLCGWTL
ncbi:hypothetical protein C0995_007263 [Termitomyces sp. Mi166|nr:hypothetical protein C0995_007263 [Termitomyces sp. Mi166\